MTGRRSDFRPELRTRALKIYRRTNSIRGTAQLMGLSYKRVWELLPPEIRGRNGTISEGRPKPPKRS